MDKATIRRVHAAIEAAVRKVAEEQGFTLLRSRMSYDEAGFKVNIGAAWKAGTVSSVDGEQIEWSRYAVVFGLPVDAFGKVFKWGGKHYRIVGIRPTARTKPVIVRELGPKGKTFVFPADVVRIVLNEGKGNVRVVNDGTVPERD